MWPPLPGETLEEDNVERDNAEEEEEEEPQQAKVTEVIKKRKDTKQQPL